jgi:GGDEF domain-containing protein
LLKFLEQFRERTDRPVDLESLAKQVEAGRKLAIYDGETGLYAYWYLVLRGEDECAKAKRYNWPLTLAVIEPSSAANQWTMRGALTSWLQLNLRSVDIGAYVGNGRFVVLMPNTDMAGAQEIERRIHSDVPGAITALADVPPGGATFQAVYAAAAGKLADASEAAA